MTVLKRRDRILIFRLTQDEYDHLLTACSSRGGRNLSDFARSELLSRVDTDERKEAVQNRLSVLDHKLSRVESTLHEVTRLLEHLSGAQE
jgi:hypothetical protein